MSGKHIVIIILGAVVGSVAAVLVLHLLGFRTSGTIPFGALGGAVGALAANAVARKK